MSALGDLVVNLVARTKQFTSPLGMASNSLTDFAQRASGLGSVGGLLQSLSDGVLTFGRRMTGLTTILGGITGAFSVIGGARWGFNLAAAAEQSEIAFKTMLGSAREARSLLADLSRFAESTPYESPEVIKAAQQLLAFGVSAREVIPTLTQLGDLASGAGQPLGELAYLFGTARTQGRLFSQDINQFTGRGIPIIGALAATMGVAEGQVKKLVEAGQVGFPQLQDALKFMTSAGSQFGGMMDAQSASVNGLLSTISDKTGQTARMIMESLMNAFDLRGILKGSIATLTTFQQFLTDNRATLESVAGMVRQVSLALGVMTAGAMAYAAAQRIATASAIMFQAAVNPATLVKVGISLGAAVGVIAAMDAGLHSVSASVVDVTTKVDQLGNAGARAKSSMTSMADGLASNASPLDGLLNRLNAWRNAKPDAIHGQAELPRIFLGEQLFAQVSTTSKEVEQLHSGLMQVQRSAELLGSERLDSFTQQIRDQIGHVTGITSAIADARIELAAFNKSEPEIFKAVERFGASGALPQQIRELENLMRSLNQARDAQAAFQEQMRLRGRGNEMITSLQDQLDVLRGTAKQTDIELRRLQREGLDTNQLTELAKLMQERDALLKKQQEESAPKMPKRGEDFSAALSRGSQDAVAAIQRSQYSPMTSQKVLEDTAKKQLKTAEKTNDLLAQVADKLGVPPVQNVVGW